MNCPYCKDTGKYKQPKNQKDFDYWVDHLVDTNGFMSISMAEEKAYKKVGFDLIDCPYCNSQPVKGQENN